MGEFSVYFATTTTNNIDMAVDRRRFSASEIKARFDCSLACLGKRHRLDPVIWRPKTSAPQMWMLEEGNSRGEADG